MMERWRSFTNNSIVIDVNEKPVILTDGNNTSLFFNPRIRSYRNNQGKLK
jgi:hypothetical protein